MPTNDTVALIVDPDFGSRIQEVAARMRHTWVVATPANVAAAGQIWKASPNWPGLNMEGGVTTFIQYGADRESWREVILDSVDDHHNCHSHDPSYPHLAADAPLYPVAATDRMNPYWLPLRAVT
ncbi:hypothetical protein [Paraburkholderia sediminicola]|uniref:hypothetical protein n=1 Tax=Paraburkholderia sediminicola TaxID=458836 RepID=UPI0038B85987